MTTRWKLGIPVALMTAVLMSYAGIQQAAQKDIVDTAIEAGQFKTLVKLVQEAGLVDALRGEGPFTVFAPNDKAFARLTNEQVEALLKDKDALRQVLLYHVVQGRVTSKEVVNLKSAKTLQGQEITIRVVDGTVYVNNAIVTTVDIETKNGVIHIIDTPILPPTPERKEQ